MYFAVHAVRNGHGIYWLFILFAFPMLGSAVYFFAIYLPSLRQSHGARAATRAVSQLVDPNRTVREARANFDRAPTVEHRMRLGAALLDAGEAHEALEHYQAAANGPFATDAALLFGLARAQFAIGIDAATAATLSRVFDANPQTRQQPTRAPWPRSRHRAHARPSSRPSPARATLHLAACSPSGWLHKTTRRIAAGPAACLRKSCTMPDTGRRDARAHNREWLRRAEEALSASAQ